MFLYISYFIGHRGQRNEVEKRETCWNPIGFHAISISVFFFFFCVRAVNDIAPSEGRNGDRERWFIDICIVFQKEKE